MGGGRGMSQVLPNCNCLGKNEDILSRDRGAPPFSYQTIETMSPRDTGMAPRVSDGAEVWRQPEVKPVSGKRDFTFIGF